MLAQIPLVGRFQVEINHRRDVERQALRHHQSADDGQAERPAGLASRAKAERDGQRGHERGHGGHHDGAEAQQAAFVNRLGGGFPLPLRVNGEVNHHDGVFLDDADEHDQADKAVDVQIQAEQNQRNQRAKARRGQAGQNRDGMNEAFVKNSENEVNDDNGHGQQQDESF